jgi:hypothetical protein
MHRSTILLLAFICCSATGCTTTVSPPAHPREPVTVYLTDYGRHSSVLLPTSPGHYTEYAFGDWNFFALGNTHWWVAAQAMVSSPRSTLGRREVAVQHSNDEQLKKLLGCRRLMRFEAERLRAEVLSINLDRTFRVSTTAPMHSTYSDLNHVPDDERYWGCHNCNHVTAAWLRQLGCDVRGPAVLSSFEMQRARVDQTE